MKNYILHSTLEFVLVRENNQVGFCNTIISCFELFVDDHEGKNNLMAIDRVFDKIFIKCCLQIFKLVIELSYIAIILKSDNVGGVKLNISLI